MYDLGGKVALVTGAGGRNGIGRAIAVRLAEEGADIVLNDIEENPRTESDWGGLLTVKREIEDLGRQAETVVADISNAADVESMVRRALSRFGRIDILVNNAAAPAGADRVPLVELEEDDWDRIMTVNAKGTFLCCKAVARTMIDRDEGGNIINISSTTGLRGVVRYGVYSASKFAVVSLTQTLARELGQYRINVNAICPATVDTERQADIASMLKPEGVSTREFTEKMYERNIQSTPLGRVAEPKDVARTVAFMASAESDYLTGISLIVAGGQYT